jgi:hypothetical protein
MEVSLKVHGSNLVVTTLWYLRYAPPVTSPKQHNWFKLNSLLGGHTGRCRYVSFWFCWSNINRLSTNTVVAEPRRSTPPMDTILSRSLHLLSSHPLSLRSILLLIPLISSFVFQVDVFLTTVGEAAFICYLMATSRFLGPNIFVSTLFSNVILSKQGTALRTHKKQ